MNKFYNICVNRYERFVQSRGGNFNPTPQQQAGQKRATLA